MYKEKITHFLVDGQKVNIGLLHRQQEDEGVALITDTGRASTAVDKSTEEKKKFLKHFDIIIY